MPDLTFRPDCSHGANTKACAFGWFGFSVLFDIVVSLPGGTVIVRRSNPVRLAQADTCRFRTSRTHSNLLSSVAVTYGTACIHRNICMRQSAFAPAPSPRIQDK